MRCPVQNNVLHLARSQQCWDTTIALIGKVAVDEHAPVALAALEHAILHSRPFTDETLQPCLGALRQLLLGGSAGQLHLYEFKRGGARRQLQRGHLWMN